MDMEKIIIRCSAEHLQYSFPKRKWYQLIRYNRIALMRLTFDDTDILQRDIRLELYENLEQDVFGVLIDPDYMQSLYRAFFEQYRVDYQDIEHMILIDDTDSIASGLLYDLAANRNYLSVLTDNPKKYEEVLQQIEMDYGLGAMVFTSGKEMLRYVKQMSEKRRILLIAGEKCKSSFLYQLPEGSFFMDISPDETSRGLVLKKRFKITYASIPIFLDNIVKNRYNAVVNEGITFQVKNDKQTVWRGKGNEDGRKEKYPDL